MLVDLSLSKRVAFLSSLNRIKILETFLAVFYKLLWRLAPSLLRFTCIISSDKNLIAFRPFIVSDRVIVNPNFEKGLQALFKPEPNQTVIDVGAHIGLYTLIACRMVGPNGKVFSTEPDKSNLKVLRKNVAINKFKNAVVLPIALSCTNGKEKIYAGIMPTGSSFYPTLSRARYKVRAVKEIKTVTLDSLIEELKLKDVDWIKIDVESADLNVLRGGKSFLQKSKKAKIIIEASQLKTLEYLQNLGFKVRRVSSSNYIAFKK